jgi:hypothetical protein
MGLQSGLPTMSYELRRITLNYIAVSKVAIVNISKDDQDHLDIKYGRVYVNFSSLDNSLSNSWWRRKLSDFFSRTVQTSRTRGPSK